MNSKVGPEKGTSEKLPERSQLIEMNILKTELTFNWEQSYPVTRRMNLLTFYEGPQSPLLLLPL